jgi:hypothetical protein
VSIVHVLIVLIRPCTCSYKWVLENWVSVIPGLFNTVFKNMRKPEFRISYPHFYVPTLIFYKLGLCIVDHRVNKYLTVFDAFANKVAKMHLLASPCLSVCMLASPRVTS